MKKRTTFLTLNFKVTGNGRYSDPEGREASRTIPRTARSASRADTSTDFTSVYHENKNRPTVSFRSGRGAEASFCEKK
jgi:hypothetical protein